MAKMLNAEEYTITMQRGDITRLMQACTAIIIEMQDEMRNPETNEYRRERVLPNSIQMWQRIHDEVERQFDEQDRQNGVDC